MNVNDDRVLEIINSMIASNRLNKNQILQLVNLASVSNSFKDLEENIKWETSKSKQLINIKNHEKYQRFTQYGKILVILFPLNQLKTKT